MLHKLLVCSYNLSRLPQIQHRSYIVLHADEVSIIGTLAGVGVVKELAHDDAAERIGKTEESQQKL